MEPAHRADVAPLLMHLHQLTPREHEVTQLLLTGMATSDIARELCVSTETVRGHAKSVYSKLDVTGRAGLVASLSSEPRVRSAGAR